MVAKEYNFVCCGCVERIRFGIISRLLWNERTLHIQIDFITFNVRNYLRKLYLKSNIENVERTVMCEIRETGVRLPREYT